MNIQLKETGMPTREMEQVRVVGCLAAHRGEEAQTCGPGEGIVLTQGTPAVLRPAVRKKQILFTEA